MPSASTTGEHGFDWQAPLSLLQEAYALLEKAPTWQQSPDAWFHQYIDAGDVMEALAGIITALEVDMKHGR